MNSYVLGFMFRKHGKEVCLIRKTHPSWQKGKYNGIGGSINKGESPSDAMIREFKEEAGVSALWTPYAILKGYEFEVFIYRAHDVFEDHPKTITEEKIKWFLTDMLPKNCIPNLRWLIPMAISYKHGERAVKFTINEDVDY